MEVILAESPAERIRNFVVDYARELYGIDNACALQPLIEVAFSAMAVRAAVPGVTAAAPREIIAASRELLRYTEQPMRAVEHEEQKTGPDFEIVIQGTCVIGVPGEFAPIEHTQQLVPPNASDSPVELHDERREEGG